MLLNSLGGTAADRARNLPDVHAAQTPPGVNRCSRVFSSAAEVHRRGTHGVKPSIAESAPDVRRQMRRPSVAVRQQVNYEVITPLLNGVASP